MSPCEIPPLEPVLATSSGCRILLKAFDITRNGFLPAELPLSRLPDAYYDPWERLIPHLTALIESRTLRERVDQLPVLSVSRLMTESEQRRAYVVLSLFANGYIWGGDTAAQRLPPPITVPLLAVSSTLGVPPIATYAAFNLWNFTSSSSSSSFRDIDSLTSLHTFTSTFSESWFYCVSVAIESAGAPLIPCLLSGLHAAKHGNYASATTALNNFATSVAELGVLLDRMHERCDVDVFYNQIRPFLAGSRNMEAAGLPSQGVFYDEGNGNGEWRALRGGSNGQSSLIQFFDVALGVEHRSGGDDGKKGMSFHEEVRGYMPRRHRQFLEFVEFAFPGGFRRLLTGDEGKAMREQEDCVAAFQRATQALAAFRGRHLSMVTRYIIIPARRAKRANISGIVNLATAPSAMRTGAEGVVKEELTGTGGTALLPFLKESRDETLRAGEACR